MPTFQQLLERPGIKSVMLVEISAAVPLAAWVYTGANSIYKHALPDAVKLSALAADEAGVTKASALSDLDSTAGLWFQSGEFIYWRTATGSVFDFDTIGTAAFFFSDTPKALENYYDPRLKSVPKLSLRIEERFGAVTQVGGGNIVFENADAFFDALAGKVRWDNGSATLKLGLDTASEEMYYFDYRTIGTWSLDGGDLTDSSFSLAVKERKLNLKLKLPSTKFTLDDYPYIATAMVGKTIPTVYGRNYGVAGFLINQNTNTVKVSSHAIKAFIGLRKKEQLSRTVTQSPDWFSVVGHTYFRTAFSGDLLSVTCNSTTMTKLDKTEDVDTTASSYTVRDNFLYLNPPLAVVPSATNTSLDVKISYDNWTQIDFATRDEANGEFTLSTDVWDGKAELSVDVIGKTSGDDAIENPTDIVADILASVGETNLNVASFDAARAWFNLGTDRRGNSLIHLRPSVYLANEQEALVVIQTILTATGSYLFVNAAGEWVFKAAVPLPSDALDLTELELFEMKRSDDTSDVPTSVIVNYASKTVEKTNQTLTESSETLRRGRGLVEHVTRTVNAALWQESDALYLAQRILNSEGFPLTKFQLHLPRLAMVIAPGDCVRVRRARGSTDEFMEVLEMNFDLASKQATLMLGDMRGWGRSCGFWMPDSATAWDSGATDEAARTAAQASGFWSDDNGFAVTADARSHSVSRWW